MLIAALRLAITFSVFPVAIYRDGGKVAKTPITAQGFKNASRDPAQIERWWQDNPAAAIGLATGHLLPSNRRLLVIDIDLPNARNTGKPAGMAALRLLASIGAHTPTRTARTGSGGMHLYYSMPHDARVNIGQNLRINGQSCAIDWRGKGGYVVAPPSPYPGSAYRWAMPSPWTAQTIQCAPGGLLALLTKREATSDAVKRIEAALSTDAHQRAYGYKALANACNAIDNSAVGTRHSTINLQAFCIGRLIAGGCLDQSEAETAITDAALRSGKEAHEVRRTIRSAFRAAEAQPRTAPDRKLSA
jgi:hypothetical protein